MTNKTLTKAAPKELLTRALLLSALLLSGAAAARAQAAESVYTELSGGKCRTLRAAAGPPGVSSSARRCPGVGGFSLLVLDDDDRQSITVVKPDGTEHPLELWHTVMGSFSTVGQKAEWRVRRRGRRAEPFALIVRFNANDPEDQKKIISFLVVSKVATQTVCVTDRILPGPGANESARRAADASAAKPCLSLP